MYEFALDTDLAEGGTVRLDDESLIQHGEAFVAHVRNYWNHRQTIYPSFKDMVSGILFLHHEGTKIVESLVTDWLTQPVENFIYEPLFKQLAMIVFRYIAGL